MERYQRGKVYRIVCRKTGKQYIGSTCKKLLSQRLACHVCDFKEWKENRHHFLTSFIILEENDYYIELVELVSCSSKDELLVRERFHIQNNDCVNKQLPSRTKEEYYEDNKKKIAEQMKEYAQTNKDQIAKYHKEYQQTHKYQIAEYHKEYKQTHKEKIAEYKKEKYDCSCGSTICKIEKARHERSLKHQNYLKNMENAEKY
jgi:hypothetical protein